jgi:hypothetical protein
MAWNTDGSSAPVETKTFCKCNGQSYDITGLEGLGLVEKLKAIARENGISKFDILDKDNQNLSPVDIEDGNFEGDLNLVRFNVAA